MCYNIGMMKLTEKEKAYLVFGIYKALLVLFVTFVCRYWILGCR